jgi:D-sedoheptulose 7-phosphate isomerase
MKQIIHSILQESIAVKERFIRSHLDRLLSCADRLAGCIATGNKILLFGNGGSAADAQHMAAELVNRFQIDRPPLAALALTTDTSILTSIGNDVDFSEIFSKQIRALGRKDDVAVGISTSGNSPNVVEGVMEAKRLGLHTIGITGPGGKLADCADMLLSVEAAPTARIQETHLLTVHVLCELVDRILYPEAFVS